MAATTSSATWPRASRAIRSWPSGWAPRSSSASWRRWSTTLPRATFAVVTKRGRSVVDPRNYARWDAFAAGVAAIDAAEAARVFSRLEPLFEAAWRELGHPEPFRDGVARATAALLAVPVVEAEVPVVPVVRAVPMYEYADRKLESLTPAQKQLLRMGPANLARIQAKLREVQAALGRP
ncbi:MAG: hypothetical protein DMF79_03650 [Acidobacteria bacterium]|nr:MAG: hypothetical protein DMF79_03650 [Acidobacteriota bacterium]